MRIIEKPGFRVIGLEVTAPWEALWTVMPNAWEAFFRRRNDIPGVMSGASMDISIEQRDGVYMQLIATEVNATALPPAGMRVLQVPAQRYLHHWHDGSLAGIALSFGTMYEWAAAQGLALDLFKLDIGYTAKGQESAHDLYIRLAD
ncbi:MAG: GyrI-like domain-containing protein [bacterium]